jgi:hypothetical protein
MSSKKNLTLTKLMAKLRRSHTLRKISHQDFKKLNLIAKTASNQILWQLPLRQNFCWPIPIICRLSLRMILETWENLSIKRLIKTLFLKWTPPSWTKRGMKLLQNAFRNANKL